jgi:hypothetical protein
MRLNAAGHLGRHVQARRKWALPTLLIRVYLRTSRSAGSNSSPAKVCTALISPRPGTLRSS